MRAFADFAPGVARAAHHPFARRLVALACLAAAMLAARVVAAERPPNIVVFLVDDLGVMDVGCYNPKTFYETPHIDRLARSATRFTAGYAACPVCSPTRASLLTGRSPPRHGITDYIGGHNPENWSRPTKLLPAPYKRNLDAGHFTLAETLKSNGYATFFAGKWHLGSSGSYPEDHGFDVNKGGVESGGPYGGKKYFSPYGNPKLEDGPPGEHLPDRLATETVKFMEANRERPFFAHFCFYSVHTPLIAREDLQKKYEAKAKTLRREGPAWGREREREVRLRQDHAVYAAMVEAMDLAVGKVLDGLDRLKLADRTIVVFTSDNGGLSTSEGHPTSNLPYRAGKGWMYEGGLRVATIVRAPGVTKPGAACDTPVITTDLYDTLLDLAGLPAQPEQTLDGESLAPLLRGETAEHGPLYWHYPHYGNQGGAPASAVREGDWKLIEWLEDGALELYNLRDDAAETKNLAGEQPERAAALRARLAKWRQDTGALYPSARRK